MSTILIGFLTAMLAGALNGSFATPMKRLGKWEWENQWMMWAFWALIVSAWGLALATVPHLFSVYRQTPGEVIFRTVLFGAAWGFGAISFGMGVHLIGLSLGFSIIVGITAVTGSLIPMLVVSPESLWTRSGAMIMVGLLITVVGVTLCGSAGVLRERALQGEGQDKRANPKFKLGFIVCVASGILNAMLNLAFVFGAPIGEIAKNQMEGAALVNFRAGNAIWAMALLGSFVTNFLYCGWLLLKKGSWKKFSEPGTGSYWPLTFLMGFMWMGGYALYGAGAATFGKLGPTVAWIILMASTVVIGNIWGFLTGEWKHAPGSARTRMILGIVVLLVSIVVVSIGSKIKDKNISKPEIETVMGQPSYVVSNDVATAALTLQGGQLGPVTFTLGDRRIEPYSVSPWWNEEVSEDIPNVARILRGDLFCLPFGLNLDPFNGEQHPVHGETANDQWTFEDFSKTSEATTLHVSMDVKVRPGRVDKWVVLPAGQTIVYQRHTISNMAGPMCLGHHAMLKIPDYKDAARLSTSRWVYGQVATQPVETPENKGYSMLKTAAVFDSLTQVPTVFCDTPTADLTTYPRGRGYEDVVCLAADSTLDIAWNCVAFPKEGYVWFALRDPKVLASTMLWLSNGGRHYAPWNGRHINVLGVEDNTAFYHYGLVSAAGPNPLNQKGVKTVVDLKADEPLTVNYIAGIAPIPGDFERVDSIEFGKNEMTLKTPNGKSVKVSVNLDFLKK